MLLPISGWVLPTLVAAKYCYPKAILPHNFARLHPSTDERPLAFFDSAAHCGEPTQTIHVRTRSRRSPMHAA
jgi:hypothetical protein